jgi:hypothetical protein
MKNMNLLENDITDWSMVIDYNSYVEITKENINQNFLDMYFDFTDESIKKNYLEIIKTKKLSYYENHVNWFDDNKTPHPTENIDLNSYKNSYINIISETKFGKKENDIHITEKSFKPLYYFQLPIFLAAYNHVKMLKDEYGFYLFDDLIDHSYDDEINDSKRFHMIVKEIQRLSNMREEIQNYYKNNTEKLLHNYNIIKNNNAEHIFKNYILNI